MAAKSKKKVEPAKAETPKQAVPAGADDLLAFVAAEKVPALLDKAYPGCKGDDYRRQAYYGKSVSFLAHQGKRNSGKKPLSLTCAGVAYSTSVDSKLCDMLLSRFEDMEVPSGYRMSQGIVLNGRVVGVIPEDLEFLAKCIATAREDGSDCVTERTFVSNVTRLLADAAAFRQACERGESEVVGF